MLIGTVNDGDQVANLRDGPKRKRTNALRARHYLFDRLTPNDSLASIGTLQVPRACREKIAVLTASIRAAPESWALIPRSSRRFRRSKNESGAHRIARLRPMPAARKNHETLPEA